MRSIENETRLTMNTRRNFVNYATMTLSDGTVLNLTPSDFRISGQSFTDDWSDGEAFQIGTAIGKTATLLLDNTDGREEEIGSSTVRYPHGKFSQYDFYMAYFQLFVCLPEAYHYGGELRDQMIPIGTFTVTTPVASSATIEITGVDNMYMFDKSFDGVNLDFSVSTGWSLKEILNATCEYCGVAIGYTTFDNENIRIYEKPENATCRQVVSYIAQIAGCNAVIDISGALKLKWYNTTAFDAWLDGGTFDTDTTPYSDGDDADGGTFNPWNIGDIADGGDFTTPIPFHNLKTIKSTRVSTDDIHFTGVSVKNGEVEEHYPSSTGWDAYALEISDNPFVVNNESDIAEFIYNRIKNLIIRPFSTSSLQDPTIEAGDCALVYDVKGNTYMTIITNVQFKTGGYTEVSCKSESPTSQNSRYVPSQAVIQAEQRILDYNKQVAHFTELANQALGYYQTVETDEETGAVITYIHDGVTIETSKIIWKITADGIFISESDVAGTPLEDRVWNNGYDASTGTMLVNLIYAHGLTSDWIRTGTLDVGGINNEDGIIRVTNNVALTNINVNPPTPVADTVDGDEIATDWLFIGPGQIDTSGTYRIFHTISNVESGKTELIKCQIQKRDKWDGSTYTFKILVDYYVVKSHVAEFPIQFTINASDGNVYYAVRFSRVATANAGFSVALYYNKINTVINNSGVNTSMLTATGGNIDGTLTIGESGYLGSSASDLGGLKIGNSTLGVSAPMSGTAWTGLYFGAEASSRSGWSKACCIIWNGGDGDAGFHVISGSPNQGNTGNFSALKQSKLQFWASYNLAGEYAQGGYYPPSDKRLKKKIKSLGYKKIRKFFSLLNPVSFVFKYKPEETRYGVIAQELEDVLAECGFNNSIFIKEQETEEHFKSVNYTEFTGFTLAGIKHLFEIVDKQQIEIDTLKQRIEQLESIVNTK